ncbi:MAG: cytochrome c-type biogenesis protein CcmH [Porticoccaceae bacterium]|jgi:cytochrome c-type biogenesis protein CcmH|nr:cytochrome c-type biogenesis protein CcmH [Porticoccaceae bacterium]|tara:strand:+ start:565 stop:1026 length:462 start_codon:yes stop_codon:yes gene_type:complete
MKRLAFVMFLLATGSVIATSDLVVFSDPSYTARYQTMITELRCPKCQNQNLADSNSPISQDLRAEVQRLLELGMTNPEIEQYLTARYSEFILYRPQVNNNTYLLWLAPIVILLIGMAIVFGLSRRPKAVPQVQRDTTQTEQQRLAELLKDGNK